MAVETQMCSSTRVEAKYNRETGRQGEEVDRSILGKTRASLAAGGPDPLISARRRSR